MKQSKYLYVFIFITILTLTFVTYSDMRAEEKPKANQEMLITKIFAGNNQWQIEQELNDFFIDIINREYMIFDLIYSPTQYNFTVMVVYGPPEYSIKYKGRKI